MDSDYLIDRYRELCKTADRLAGLGWRSEREDGQKRRYAMTAEVLDRFADYVFGGIGFEVSDFFGVSPSTEGILFRRSAPKQDQRQAYLEQIAAKMRALEDSFHAAGIPPQIWLPLIAADGVVGGFLLKLKIHGREVLVSDHTLRVAPRALKLRSALGEIPPSVLEIGGGHGRFVRDVMKLSSATRVTYCDLPFNLLLAARYLSRVFPGEVALAWDDEPIADGARITIVPPWRLAEVPYAIDVCCNFLSFQHMQVDNLAFYGAALDRLGIPAIYHVNRLTAFHPGEVALDDYPFRAAYELRSRTVVSRAELMRRVNGIVQPAGTVDQIEEVLVRRPG